MTKTPLEWIQWFVDVHNAILSPQGIWLGEKSEALAIQSPELQVLRDWALELITNSNQFTSYDVQLIEQNLSGYAVSDVNRNVPSRRIYQALGIRTLFRDIILKEKAEFTIEFLELMEQCFNQLSA